VNPEAESTTYIIRLGPLVANAIDEAEGENLTVTIYLGLLDIL
jgi:hypothetical protein